MKRVERQVLEFLCLLEQLLPPPDGCHHNLTVGSGGLTLAVRYGSAWHTFSLDDGDIGKPETIEQIVAAAYAAEGVDV